MFELRGHYCDGSSGGTDGLCMSLRLRTCRLLTLAIAVALATAVPVTAAVAQTRPKANGPKTWHPGYRHRRHHHHRRGAHRGRTHSRHQRGHATRRHARTAGGCSDLFWPAPALSSPITINIPASGGGYYQLDNRRDYNIVLPSTTRVGPVQIDGGRNITIIGGALRNNGASGPALLYFTDYGSGGAADPGRIIHVAHVSEDLSGGSQRDAIALQTPSAIVELEDIHVVGVHGAGIQNHSDMVQNYSAVRELRVDRFTGESDYQGFFIRPQEGAIGKVTLRRVNLQLDHNSIDAYSQLLFLTNPDGSTDPISFDQVYVDNTRAGQTAQAAVYPDATATHASTFDQQISFPGYPQLHGTIDPGTPPNGNFACS